MYLYFIYKFNYLHIYILSHGRTESEIKKKQIGQLTIDQKGIRGSFAVIVNAFIIKWKKWKNVGKSYLAIPVVWTTGLMINGFFWSCLLLYGERFTVNGIKHPRLHQHKVLTRRLRLPIYPPPPPTLPPPPPP